MRVYSKEIELLKSTARILDRDYVNRRGLGFSKEVLWVSVGQRAAELRAVRVGGQKKDCADRSGAGEAGSKWADWQNFFLTSNFYST